MRTWFVAAIATLALVVAACGSDRDTDDADEERDEVAGSVPPTIEAEDDFVLPATTMGAPPPPWVEHTPGEDCRCADGSEFSYWTREGRPDKVALYFQGGGTCALASTCAFDSGVYVSNASGVQATGTDAYRPSGIFDPVNPSNPIVDWTLVFVPHCTGDAHLGNTVVSYGPDLTVDHVGLVNSRHALDHVIENHPGASDVLVAGSGAGAVPTPLFAGLLGDALPEARISVLADSAGAYPDDPSIGIGATWDAFASVPQWPVNAGLRPEDWSVPRVLVQAARHDGDIRFARYDAAYDAVQQETVASAGIEGDLLTLIRGNEFQIEVDVGTDIQSYVAPGDTHTILTNPEFFEVEVDGVSFVTWLGFFLAGEEFGDVVCEDCANPDEFGDLGCEDCANPDADARFE